MFLRRLAAVGVWGEMLTVPVLAVAKLTALTALRVLILETSLSVVMLKMMMMSQLTCHECWA